MLHLTPLFAAVLDDFAGGLFRTPVGPLEAWQWIGAAVALLLILPVSGWLSRATLAVGGRAASFTRAGWDDELLAALRAPMRLPFLAAGSALGARLLLLPVGARSALDVIARTLVIFAVAWGLFRTLKAAAAYFERRVAATPSGANEGRVRGLKTQLVVLRHVLEVVIVVVASSLVLLQFEGVRSVGVSLLASAGVAGLVIGLAAQKSISSLLAGVQLSITQPVRIGDTVIVENEWGWIEEITLTYVVVKVWDLRRLVVPITHFLDKPFQNWSKVSPEILGTVELYTDYRVDLGGLRAELARVLETQRGALWDGKVQGVQVTGCTERTMLVRVLVSSTDAGKSWDLRCLIREQLLDYLSRQTAGLPVLRLDPPAESGATLARAPIPARNTVVPSVGG